MLQQDDLLHAIDLCYEAVAAHDGFQRVVSELGRLIAADAGDMVTEDILAGTTDTLGSFGFDPVFRDSYNAQYLGENPWVETLASASMGRFHGNEVDPPDFYNSAYYNEWVKPQGFHDTIGALLSFNHRKWTWLGFTRKAMQEGFDDTRDFLDRLFPHLVRAFLFRSELDILAEQHKSLINRIPKPVLIIGSDRRVIEMNDRAADQLDTGRFIRLDRLRRLRAVNLSADRRLQAAITSALDVMSQPEALHGSCEGLSLPDGEDGAASAFMTPLRGSPGGGTQVLVTISCPEEKIGSVSALSTIYNLSDKEISLARALVYGDSLKDFAERENIAIGTARWHLKNLEQKCGVHRIEKLVAHLHLNLPTFR